MDDSPADWVSDSGRRVTDSGTGRVHSDPDSRGFSYIEVMVAVVLVGITVIATLVGLRTTVIAGRVGAERSELLGWLQDGADALHRQPYVPCGPPGTMTTSQADAIRNTHQATVDAVTRPDGMSGGVIVVGAPDFLSIDPASFTERWHDRECDPSFAIAAVRLTATSPEGTTVDLEVIIDG